MHRNIEILLILATSLVITVAQNNGYPRYSPCAPPTLVNKGDPFVIGLAFWPGGTVLQWGGAGVDSTGKPGLNPCIGDVSINGSTANYQQYLTSKNVSFSTYSVSVDTLTALRTTRLEEDLMFNLAKVVAPDQVISMIAFRGNIRSEAQYIRSASSITGGQGAVDRLGLVVTLDNGNLTSLTWFNFDGCNSCGGTTSSTCIQTKYDPAYQVSPQASCATPLSDKGCSPCVDTTCQRYNCTTTTLVSFRGSTKSGQPLQSAYQMETAFKYSIYDVLSGLANNANQIGQASVGPTGQGIVGAGQYGNSTALALPGGQVSDSQLAAAQSGILPPPPPDTTSTPAAPVAVSPPATISPGATTTVVPAAQVNPTTLSTPPPATTTGAVAAAPAG